MTQEPADDGHGRASSAPAGASAAPPGFVEVRDGEGRLLFFFDAGRDLIQIKPKGAAAAILIDLRMYRPRGEPQGKAV